MLEPEPSSRNYLEGVFHLALAAFLAICFLRFAESFSALALPPLRPPFRPCSDKYSEIDCVVWPVDISTMAWANWFESTGSFLLERLMHRVCSRLIVAVNPSQNENKSPPTSLATRQSGVILGPCDILSLSAPSPRRR